MTYDEVVLGRRWHTATYAHDPGVTFRAATAAEAVRQLEFHMAEVQRLLDGARFPGAGAKRPPFAAR